MSTNFAELVRGWARSRGDAPALLAPLDGGQSRVSRWRTVTYSELDRLVDRFAAGLARRGVRRGDRVLTLVKPSVELYAALLAFLRIGAVPILIDPGMGLRRVLRCIEHIRPAVVLAIPLVRLIRVLAPSPFRSVRLHLTTGLRWLRGKATLGACLAAPGARFETALLKETDDALIAFTSGSTGPAKGVTFTHGMLAEQTRLLTQAYGWEPGQRMVMCFAAFVLYTLGAGLTTILPAVDMSKPASARPERIAEAANEHRAELAFASPIVWMNLVRSGRPALRLDHVRQVITSGAPIQPDLHERLLPLLAPGATLHTPYGATEALPVTTIDSSEVLPDTARASRKGHGTCVGRPLPSVQLEIIRVTDDPISHWSDELRLAPGKIGEIVVGGAMVSPAYKEHEAANAAAKIDRGGRVLHRMGDLGYLDERGRLWFCGRKDQRLETAGGMVPTVPPEGVFNAHPRVLRTALVGVGKPGAQVPVLCLEMEAPARFDRQTVTELRALAAATRWDGLIDTFLVHPHFPVDARHNSKIKRGELAVWAARRLAKQPPSHQEAAS